MAEITEELLRGLLEEQHPDLAGLPLRHVEGGWGNQMWRLGDQLVLRVQHMASGHDQQLKERRWLPLLAPRLPLPIPVPVRDGFPSARLPRIWTVMTWVEGEPADLEPITRGEHAADLLAGFLRALHMPAPADGPSDTTGHGAHPRDSTAGFHHYLDSLDTAAVGPDKADLHAVWADAAAAPPWADAPVWVHGACIPPTSPPSMGRWPA